MRDLQPLQDENAALRAEVDRLNLEVKKLSREVRISKSFLDRVTKASEAKDALSSALTAANARQKAYTGLLLENCPSIIALLDEDGRFVLSTKALLSATGVPNFDFIKNRSYDEVLSEYLSPDGMERFKAEICRAAACSEVVSFEAWIDFDKTGEPNFYSIELRKVGGGEDGIDGLTTGMLIVMVDLTDFMREKQRAQAANNAKSDFLAAMSHEIRTPMNVIMGMSTILEKKGINPEHQRQISDIRKASDSLLDIINDILDFSKIEAGKMETVNVDYCLTGMLGELRALFSVMSEQKQLEFRFELNPDLPENICGDEGRTRQVLTNLLSNAFKYTRQGSVTFLAWPDGAGNLRFDIKDTGIGIPEADFVKIFKPFEQLDARKNRNIVGTGLGLAISYNLCRLMGGDIWVNSVYGEGSTFSVRLPYLPAKGVATEEESAAAFTAPHAKVLVVDDIETNLVVAESMLEFFEIVPDLARGGREAVEFAAAKDYDLIFMDHMMPEVDGLEATHKIRELGGHYAHAPIVALTANAIKGTEQLFLENQMDDVLPKPIEFTELAACLRKWLPASVIVEEA